MIDIKPKYPIINVRYYTNKVDLNGMSRMVQVDAELQLTSPKKGYVKDCLLISLDLTGRFVMNRDMITEEIGKTKFLSAMYKIEEKA